PCSPGPQHLREAGRRPQVIKAAAPPEGAAALIAARGPAAATSRPQKSLQLTIHPQADERLDKSFVLIHRD
ncbi:MAG: hypothetical protein ACK53L_31800, partial [Pirellulaceae bacterium]